MTPCNDIGKLVESTKTNASKASATDQRRANLINDSKGSVSVIAAVAITAILFVLSFMVDLSILYVAQQRSQTIADVANLGAATTTVAISGGVATPAAIATAKNIIEINGFGSSTASIAAVPSPRGDGTLVLNTTLQHPTELGLGLLSSLPNIMVAGASWTSSTISGDCLTSVLADITVLTNTTVTGSNCSLRAKTDFHICWNSNVNMSDVHVGFPQQLEAPLICPNSSMTPSLSSFHFSDTVTDAYAPDSRISGLKSQLNAMLSGWTYGISPPVNPIPPPSLMTASYSSTDANVSNGAYWTITATGSNLAFSGFGAPDVSCAAPTTLTGTFSLSGTNILTFSSGCYVFGGAVQIADGATVAFNVAAGAKAVFVFQGGLSTGSNATVTFGNASYYFNAMTISNGTGSKMTFGTGPFYMFYGKIWNSAGSSIAFGNGPYYFYLESINNNGTMTYGDGPYYLQSSSLNLNSYSNTTFGVGDFYFYGGALNATGSALTLGSGGSASSGSGTFYMTSGTFFLGRTVLTARGMTFALLLSVQTLQDPTLIVTAPTDVNPARGVRDVAFAVFTGAFNLYQNYKQANTLAGLIYAPLSFLSITGGSDVGFPSGGCLQLVAGSIGLNTGTTVALAPCSSFATISTNSYSGKLIQ